MVDKCEASQGSASIDIMSAMAIRHPINPVIPKKIIGQIGELVAIPDPQKAKEIEGCFQHFAHTHLICRKVNGQRNDVTASRKILQEIPDIFRDGNRAIAKLNLVDRDALNAQFAAHLGKIYADIGFGGVTHLLSQMETASLKAEPPVSRKKHDPLLYATLGALIVFMENDLENIRADEQRAQRRRHFTHKRQAAILRLFLTGTEPENAKRYTEQFITYFLARVRKLERLNHESYECLVEGNAPPLAKIGEALKTSTN